MMVFLCWIGILGGLGLAWLVGSLWMAISVIQCGEGDWGCGWGGVGLGPPEKVLSRVLIAVGK